MAQELFDDQKVAELTLANLDGGRSVRRLRTVQTEGPLTEKWYTFYASEEQMKSLGNNSYPSPYYGTFITLTDQQGNEQYIPEGETITTFWITSGGRPITISPTIQQINLRVGPGKITMTQPNSTEVLPNGELKGMTWPQAPFITQIGTDVELKGTRSPFSSATRTCSNYFKREFTGLDIDSDNLQIGQGEEGPGAFGTILKNEQGYIHCTICDCTTAPAFPAGDYGVANPPAGITAAGVTPNNWITGGDLLVVVKTESINVWKQV